MGWIKDLQIKSLERKAKRLQEKVLKLNSYDLSHKEAFDFFKPKEQTSTVTKHIVTRPNQVDWTDQYSANQVLLWALYHNEYPGFKLAGFVFKKPIDIPIQLMGIPVPKCENVKIEKALLEWVEKNQMFFEWNHKMSHITGNSWIWPKYSSSLKKVIIEFIPDSSVLSPIKDIETGEIVKIVTDEQIQIAIGDGDITSYARRVRVFTKETIQITWRDKGNVPGLKDITYRNVIGILPINFANNRGADEVRGHSDYESIIPAAKNYHDTELAASKALGKFTIKQIHTLPPGDTGPEDWEKNNGITCDRLNVLERDFFVNRYEEKDEYKFPDGALDAYNKRLEVIFWQIMEGSPIPEVFWGGAVPGNRNSVGESKEQVVKFTNQKRNQHTDNYVKLFSAIATLYGILKMNSERAPVTVEWNVLDSLDEVTKVEILDKFATATGNIIDNASGTLEQVYELWVKMYPEITPDTFEEWKSMISATAKHKAFKDSTFELIADMEGSDMSMLEVENKPEVTPGEKLPDEEEVPEDEEVVE
jgi:hypothetical protein